jgi:glycosyltransferase involved in cell wall biosynthesis
MIINMTTIAIRSKHYVDRTLASLFDSDGRDIPVNLILGSKDTSHIEQYKNVANIVPWDREAHFMSKENNLRHNCSVNAIRALKYGDDDYCVTCEDDISFARDWYSRLMETIAEIERKDYVLNLGQGSDQPSEKRYEEHSGKFLCGAQGIFYPSKPLRERVADYLQRHLSHGLNDMLVGKYAKEFAALYNTMPALVFHIGAVSSFRQQASK